MIVPEFIKNLAPLDKDIFRLVNQQWTSEILDQVMVFLTDFEKTVYLTPILLMVILFMKKIEGVKLIVASLMIVLITDVTAAKVLKPMYQRERPQFSVPNTRLLVPSQTSESFPSNHAANCFGVATFLALTMSYFGLFTMLIAFLVAYSRVYVGVHFPGDVLGGALLGILVALIFFKIYRRFEPDDQDEYLSKLPKAPGQYKHEGPKTYEIDI